MNFGQRKKKRARGPITFKEAAELMTSDLKSQRMTSRLGEVRKIEMELYNLPEVPEIGSIVRALIRHVLGVDPKFTLAYQLFFTLLPNALYILMTDIVTMIVTHGMIAVQTIVDGDTLEIVDNLQDETLYAGAFSFASPPENSPYQIFTAPMYTPKVALLNPFRGLCSWYLPHMLKLRAADNNMMAGMAGSTQRTTSISSEPDLFKVAKSLNDSTEADNEWDEHNTLVAAADDNTTIAAIEDPARKQFRRTMEMIVHEVYDRVQENFKAIATTYDAHKGIITIDHNMQSTTKTPPGVKVTTTAPVSTGVASAHLVAERVRNEMSVEYGLANDLSAIVEITRANAESILNDICVALLNPEVLGPVYLSAIVAEYHKLAKVTDLDKIENDDFPMFNSLFEMSLTEIVQMDDIKNILEHFSAVYFEMETIVQSEIEKYRARDTTVPIITVLWSAVDKKKTMEVKLDANKKSAKSVDSDA